MLQPGAAVDAFRAASDAFLATVRAVRDWDAPSGIGQWTVRELAGHTLRAYTTIETYLAAESHGSDPVPDPTAYYRLAISGPGIHEGVAARGRDAGAALTDPVPQAEATVSRVLGVIDATPGDAVVNLLAGPMRLDQYLATRAVELTIHTLDIQRAVGTEMNVPDESVRLCLDILLPLAEPTDLLLAITGRASVNVLG